MRRTRPSESVVDRPARPKRPRPQQHFLRALIHPRPRTFAVNACGSPATLRLAFALLNLCRRAATFEYTSGPDIESTNLASGLF